MATLQEKWKNWLEEQEKERGNLDTPSPFSSEELDQLLKQAADILGIDLQQTQQPQQTSQLPVRGSIAASPFQRTVQSLDEALLPERIREDIQEGQYDRSTAYAFMPIWGPIEALLQTAPGKFIDRISLGAIDAIFRDPTYTNQYRQDTTTGNTTADAIAETIGNIIGSMWLYSQAGQPAQAAAQLVNNQLAQALIRGVGTAGMTHLLQSISAPEEYRPTFDEFAQRAAWLTTTGALAPSVTNLYDTLAGQSGLNRVLFNPIVRSGVTGAATGGIGSLASQAAAGFKDAENIGDVLKKAGTDALVYGGFQALMQLPGMIGNREVHNIYARGANAQKTYANLIRKVIDGTATPDEVNQLRESIIQYGKAAQDIYPHAMRQAPAGTKLSREEFVRGFLRLLSPLADRLPSNISGDKTIEFFAHLITGKVIDVTPNTSANVPAVVKPSQQSTDVPAVAATAEINVPTTSVATTTSQTQQFVPQPTAQNSQISPISGAEQINKPQDNELHIEEKQPVRESLNDSRSENSQQFTLVDLGTRFMNIYQQYRIAALNNQKVRPELVNLFINAGNELKEYLQKQGGISRTRELPNLIQRLHNDGIKLPDFQQALQTHAEVVEAQEKVSTNELQQPTSSEPIVDESANELAETTTNAAQPTQVNTQAERIRKIAAGLDKQIEAKRNSGIHNQRLTPRRATIIDRLNEEAAALELLQAKMNKVADAIEQGTIPETLAKLSQKAQFEQLDAVIRAIQYRKDPQTGEATLEEKDFRNANMYPSINLVYLRNLLNWTKGKPGSAKAQGILTALVQANDDKTFVTLSEGNQIQAVKTLLNIAKESQGKEYSFQAITNAIRDYDRLVNMGITDNETYAKVLADYYALTKDVTAKEPSLESKIKAMERELVGTNIPGYFPTPKNIVDQMIELADIEPGMKVLEPSAGKGNIADALRQTGADVDVVEPAYALRQILEAKGHNLVGTDFLEHTGEYERIVMNPPFENGQDIDHVRHAYELLKPGGKLVAIMSEGSFFRSDKKAVAFREWLDEVGGISEPLPEGAFKSSERPTGVHTRIVVIEKPEEVAVQPVATESAPQQTVEAVRTSKEEQQTTAHADETMEQPVARKIEPTGRVSVTYTPEGRRVETRFAIVDVNDLVTSDMANYPQELQPRDRTRLASKLQIEKIANTLTPERLGDSPDPGSGSPIVGDDLVVESGNGRVMAIRKAFENAAKLEEYKQWLRENAADFGIDPAIVDNIETPVLVRVRTSDVDRVQFTQEANRPVVASMSPVEQAKVDAQKLTIDLLSSFVPSETGRISIRDNNQFITEFFAKVVGTTELGEYLTDDGELNRRGLERIQNAILAKAYGENIYVLSKLLEETDDNIKRVTAGLLNAAGSFAKIKEGIANGDYFDLDITNELTNAAGQLSHIRNRGMTVDEYLQTVALPGMEDLTDTEKLLLQKLDQFGGRGGSQKKLTAFLKNYVRLVQEVGSPKQEVLPGFEKEPPTKDELIEAASSRVAIDLQLFAQKGDGDIDGEQAYTADDWAELLHRFAGITEEVAAGESPAAVSDQQAAGGQEGTGTPGERSTVPQQPEQAESAEQTDTEDETGKPIKRIEIVHKLRQLATIYEKRMRLSAKRYRGEYHPKTQVIRVKSIEDIDALAHELGHYLQDVWEFDPSGNAELVRMGTELYADRADKMTQKRLAEEGFAEYMRYWMQYPQILEHKAPNFKETFDSLLNSDPELAKELTELRDMYKQWQNLNAPDKIKGQIVTDLEATKPREFLTPLQKAYTKTTDNLHPLFRFMETMLDKKLNSEWEVELDKNPYIMARMARAAKKIAEVMVNFKGVTPEGRIEGKSLAEILKPIKSELEDFTAWLVAKRAAELHNRGIKTGFDHADVEITIHELEKPIYLEVQKDLEAYQNNLLDFLVDSGIVSQEQADNWKALNQFYVPFYRFFDDEYRFSGKVSSKRYADLNKPIKGIKGSERSIIDPLESIIKNTYTFIDLAAKNKVGLAIAKLADDPDVVGKGWLIHEVKTPMEPQKVNLEQLKSDLVDAGIPEEIIDMVDLDKWATVFRPVQFARTKEKQENILTVYQNGKPRFFKVHPELYETIMVIEPNTSSVLTQFLAPFVAVKRALATGFNPNFTFGRNPVRDAQTAQFFSKYGFVPFIDTLRGISHVLKRDEIYYEWLVNGGGMSTMISLDRKYLRGELESILKDEPKTRPRDLVKKGWQWYLALAEGLEEATRVQVYAKGKEAETKARGADTKEGRTWAAYASREATLDFQRYGTVGKAVNNFKAFFNANVQGTDKALRYIKHQIKTNPVGFIMRAFLRITLPSLLLYLMNKDDAEYWELPEWRRDLYWNIKIAPGRWMTVPKPEVLGVFFGAVPERFFDYVNTNDPEAFEELGKNVAESLLPATSVWDLVPDAVLPILEVTANYDSWRGRQIETMSDRNKPPEERYGMWTSETAKAIGAMFGVSPKKVEHLIEGYGSGTVSFLLDMIDLMTEEGRSKSDVWSSIPVVSSFVTSSYHSPESVDDFYNTLEEYELYYPDHPYTTILRKYSRELSDLRKQINDIMESPKFDRSYKQKMLEQYNKQAVQIAKLALLRKPKQPPRKQ